MSLKSLTGKRCEWKEAVMTVAEKLANRLRKIDGVDGALTEQNALAEIREFCPRSLDEYLVLRDMIEEALDENLTDQQYEVYLYEKGLLDMPKIRRRIENWLRKSASDESLLKMARWSGVRRY